MDWDQIEQEVHFQTQQAMISVSGTREVVKSNINRNHLHDTKAVRNEQFDGNRSKSIRLPPSGNHGTDSPLEEYVQDLRNVAILQNKKVLSIENILSSYSEVFESASVAQASLEMRLDGLEQNIRGSNKFAVDASKERSALSILVKNMSGKMASLEDTLQNNEHCYATKEAFAQLLDSTVDEIKSVGVVVSQASVKSLQSVSLVEALIQAIHRMRGQADNFSFDETDAAGRSLSFEFLSSLTG